MAEFHPLADTFPLLEGDDFDGLVKDIDQFGLRHPVVMFEGKILDGRNRYRATQKLGMPHREVPFRGNYEEAVQLVISENIHRRHLSPAQRALAAEQLATALQGRPRTKGPDGTEAEHQTTIKEAATLLDASPTSVKRVRAVRAKGEEEVVKAMEAGTITPTAAESIATLPAEDQKEVMAEKDPKKIAATASKIAKTRTPASPLVLLGRQMDDGSLSGLLTLAKDWDANKDLIKELDAEKVTAFLRELRKVRTAVGKLVTLVEGQTSPAAKAKAAPAKKAAAAPKGAAKVAPRKAAPAKKAPAPKA